MLDGHAKPLGAGGALPSVSSRTVATAPFSSPSAARLRLSLLPQLARAARPWQLGALARTGAATAELLLDDHAKPLSTGGALASVSSLSSDSHARATAAPASAAERARLLLRLGLCSCRQQVHERSCAAFPDVIKFHLHLRRDPLAGGAL